MHNPEAGEDVGNVARYIDVTGQLSPLAGGYVARLEAVGEADRKVSAGAPVDTSQVAPRGMTEARRNNMPLR